MGELDGLNKIFIFDKLNELECIKVCPRLRVLLIKFLKVFFHIVNRILNFPALYLVFEHGSFFEMYGAVGLELLLILSDNKVTYLRWNEMAFASLEAAQWCIIGVLGSEVDQRTFATRRAAQLTNLETLWFPCELAKG